MNKNTDNRMLNNYIKELKRFPPLSRSEELHLGQCIKKGSTTAFKKLVNHNLRFVIAVAKMYQNKGLELLDLVNEGNLGLMEAARRYDATKKLKFNSYAVWWIRQSILLALAKMHSLGKIPPKHSGELKQVLQAAHKIEQETAHVASTQDIAEVLDISERKVRSIQSLAQAPVSIDATVFNEDNKGVTIKDELVSDSDSPDVIQEKSALKKLINKNLAVLTSVQRKAVKLHFGIEYSQRLNFREIGNCIGFSHERARQLKNEALEKLRNPRRVRVLREATEGILT